MPRSLLLAAGLAVGIVCSAMPALAEAQLASHRLTGDRPTLDGTILDDWRGPQGKRLEMLLFGEPERQGGAGPYGGDEDASYELAMTHDRQSLWVALRVQDDALVVDGDHAELWFGVPQGQQNELAAVGVGLFWKPDGVLEVRWLGKGGRPGAPIDGARAAWVGTEASFEAEAELPWKSLLGAGGLRMGLRAAAYFVDHDPGKGAAKNLFGSQPARVKEKPGELLTLVQGDLVAGAGAFRAKRGLPEGSTGRFSLAANLTGGREPEGVEIIDRCLVVHGPEVGTPDGFVAVDLPIPDDSAFKDAEVLDVTGDGFAEVVVSFSDQRFDDDRDWIVIYRLVDKPRPRFEEILEIATSLTSSGFFLENRYRFVVRDGGQRAVEVSLGKTRNVPKDGQGGVVPEHAGNAMVVPWSQPAKTSYVFDGRKFVRESP